MKKTSLFCFCFLLFIGNLLANPIDGIELFKSDSANECTATAASPSNTDFIEIQGLTPDANSALFDSDFNIIYSCNPWSGNVCGSYQFVDNLLAGTYYLTVVSENCEEWITIVVDGESGPCETDSDNDGVCDDNDCEPFIAFYPATPGTPCDDGSAGTENDVVQANGCDCLGSPINEACMISVNTTETGTVTITGLAADTNSKLFDNNIDEVWRCNPWNGTPCTNNEIINNLITGTYFLSVQSLNCDEWIQIDVINQGGSCIITQQTWYTQLLATPDLCDNYSKLTIANYDSEQILLVYNAAGGIEGWYPCDGSFFCDEEIGENGCGNALISAIPTQDVWTDAACTSGCNVTVFSPPNTDVVEINGLTDLENTKLFDNNINEVWSCNPWNGNPCTATEFIQNLDAGTYFLSIQSDNCEEWITVIVDGESDPCQIDSDNDGICDDEDCQPFDSFYPAIEGTPCDDGFAGTENDVVLASGCECMGTPIETECNVVVEFNPNSIAILGLPIDANAKLFDSDISEIWGCNPWNGSPCASNENVDDLISGTYFLSIQSLNCEEWIEFEIINFSCPDTDEDGFCDENDCAPNDPELPAEVGSVCNDFNELTTNDVILADGCTCQGTLLPQGNEYFVATDGSNSNAGTIESPWLTIQYGVEQLTPGDILNIRAGSYAEKISIGVSGTDSEYITIRAYQNENVVLDANTFSDANAIIYVENSAYINIEGLHLTNNKFQFASGIYLTGTAHHINIVNNKISNIQFDPDPNAPVNFETNANPLIIWANQAPDSIHHVNIIGNEVFDNITGFSENIASAGNFSHFLIEGNSVHDNTNIGIDITGNYNVALDTIGEGPNAIIDDQYDQGRYGTIRNNLVYNCNSDYAAAAGIYVDGGRDILVENNVSHNNGYGGEIGCEEDGSASNVIFRNNVFYENEFAGFSLGGYNTATTGIVRSSSILNNTFYNNDTGNNFHGPLLLSELEDCVIENNIFYISDQNVFQYSDRTQTNLTLDYNLVYSNNGPENIIVSGNYNEVGLQNYYDESEHGANSTYGDPLFFFAPQADFHITNNSPAINAGNPAYIADASETDIDNTARISDGIIDCGADEFGILIGDITPNENDQFNIASEDISQFEIANLFPNPATTEIFVSIETIVDGDFDLQIFDVMGKLKSTTNRHLEAGKSSIAIDLMELTNGIYHLAVFDRSGHSKTVRFVVNK